MSTRRAANSSNSTNHHLSSSSLQGGGSAGTTGTATSTTTLHSEDFQARMGQILDDQDHKRCSEGNHRALLAENLDQLRGLLKVIEADDWKYAPTQNNPMSSAHPLFHSESEYQSSG